MYAQKRIDTCVLIALLLLYCCGNIGEEKEVYESVMCHYIKSIFVITFKSTLIFVRGQWTYQTYWMCEELSVRPSLCSISPWNERIPVLLELVILLSPELHKLSMRERMMLPALLLKEIFHLCVCEYIRIKHGSVLSVSEWTSFCILLSVHVVSLSFSLLPSVGGRIFNNYIIATS